MASTQHQTFSTSPDLVAHRTKSVHQKSQMQNIDCGQKWDEDLDPTAQSPFLEGYDLDIDSPYIDSVKLGGVAGMSPRGGAFSLDRHSSGDFVLPESHVAFEQSVKLHGEHALTTLSSDAFATLEAISSLDSSDDESEDEEDMPLREAELRAWSSESGLSSESRFLSHWFGLKLTDDESATEEALPRPTPWNYFMTESRPVAEAKAKTCFGIRAFALDAGLADDSKFLSHWFGMKSDGESLDEQLPRPSAWNYFANDDQTNKIVQPENKTGFGLRAFAMDAGLSEDSKFLSHWFGLTDCSATLKDQLPRPSAWNYFTTQEPEALVKKPRSHMPKAEAELRNFASGLASDSKFLSHWFGLSTLGEKTITEQLPRPSAWNMFSREIKPRPAEQMRSGFGLRAFAMDAGLAEDSKFLSHWFGVTNTGSDLEERLPRPSPWNRFAPAEPVQLVKPETKRGHELRAWAFDAGLADDSQFLYHWFGLTNNADNWMDEKLPRPSPWNHFVTEKNVISAPSVTTKVDLSMSHQQSALRFFAEKAGLPDESRFLSHWFGLKRIGDESSSSEMLPRPSTWNMFTPAAAPAVNKNKTVGFGLRAFAMDAGLAEDSKFLSHWFGMTNSATTMEDKLPRPSPWNRFVPETAQVLAPTTRTVAKRSARTRRVSQLRTWAKESGLDTDSKFLSHWFGISAPGAEGALTEKLPRPSPWNRFVSSQQKEMTPGGSFQLRSWAADAGLPQDSKFLSHWFGISTTARMEDKLPRPTPWNYFIAEGPESTQAAGKNGYALRAFAKDAGLSEDSKFLSHWFGLPSMGATMDEKLPRPSPWNYFSTEMNDIVVPSEEPKAVLQMPKLENRLRAFAKKSGLSEESRFLSHWFGMTRIGQEDSLDEALPRPSPWNAFNRDMSIAPIVKRNTGCDLRAFAFNAGLSDDSAFLSHWFGLACGTSSTDKIPRPSPWNKFITEQTHVIACPVQNKACKMPRREAALRVFAHESGLADDSKFLSHWFGLKRIGDESSSSDKLPRPSRWNMFTRDLEPVVIKTKKSGFALRAWAQDSGLAEDSKFLSHWFGLTGTSATMDDQLPRPSAWNYFTEGDDVEEDEPVRNGFTLHAWAFDAGLSDDSQFLSHWFGIQNTGVSTVYTNMVGPARTSTPWICA
jgi:hypothetical protein